MVVTGKRILLLFFLIFLFNGRYCSGSVVTFFSDSEYKSTLFQAEDSMECKNVSASMTSKIGSVLTDGCTVFYSLSDCKIYDKINTHVMLTIDQGEKKNLSDYKMNFWMRSFRRCSKSVNEIQVEVFRDSNLRDSLDKFTINHNECNTIYKESHGTWGWQNKTKAVSVKTNGCIIAYVSLTCSSAGMMIKPSEGHLKEVDLSSYTYVGFNGIGSFRACKESERTSEIKFFKKDSNKDLLYLGLLRDECSLLPDNFASQVGNVWSSECVMLYARFSCNIYGFKHPSLKVDPHKLINLQMYDEFKTNQGLQAYRRCSSTEGGERAEIKFYGKEKHENYLTSFVSGNLAGCTELPSNFTVKSVENHGTCLQLYHEPECRDWARDVFGGHTYGSQFLRKSTPMENATEDFLPFRSFKLCQTLPYWSFQVSSTTFKIQVRTNFSREFMQQEGEMVRVGEDEVFVNKGGGNINGPFVTKGAIAESMRVEMLSGVYEAMNSLTIEIINQSGNEIPSLLKTKIDAALMSAYTRPTSSADSQADTVVILNENRDFSVAKKFQVPPCTTYNVGMSVRVANLSMEYDVFTQITGILRGVERMTAEVLEQHLPTGLEYVRKVDDFTVEAKGKGKITARYGFKPVFSAVGIPIDDCQLKSC